MNPYPRTVSERFANYLSMALKEKNMTYDELAKAIGVSRTTVNNMINGHRVPRLSTWEAAFTLLGVEVGLRLKIDDEKPLTPAE